MMAYTAADTPFLLASLKACNSTASIASSNKVILRGISTYLLSGSFSNIVNDKMVSDFD